eukprot:TRINITY_DN9270_c0_g1_i1.p1 TRINITY_DN9270_c0_g1~~TRINITY_DN9270_c0_g1_i1.p1  ORF type:complete len:373 (+),score=40.36 TRINITY_DN9270_c0_g1_i1:74-1192(+)
MEQCVAGKFRVGAKIGSGSFGNVYMGTVVSTGEEVAIKVESIGSRHPRLFFESKIYKMMGGAVGVPKLHWYGVAGDYNVMVIDLLGPSLEDLFHFCNRKFSLKTTLILADQMLTRVEYIHARNILHRDLKPANFAIGLGKKVNRIHIIDFGLSKHFTCAESQQHTTHKEYQGLIGTARYASVNAHLGCQQSRRDDLEAVGYILMYFIRGSLPWQGVNVKSRKAKLEQIRAMKTLMPLEVLCKNCPPEFAAYLNYCRNLRFEQSPDYAHLRRTLNDAFRREGCKCDFIFDWTILYMQSKNQDADCGSQREGGSDSEGEGETRVCSSETALSLPSPAGVSIRAPGSPQGRWEPLGAPRTSQGPSMAADETEIVS